MARTSDEFTRLVRGLKPGKYTATVMRKGKEVRIRNIELAEASKSSDKKDWMVEDEKEKAAKAKEEAKKTRPKAKKEKDKDGDDFAGPASAASRTWVAAATAITPSPSTTTSSPPNR